MGGTVLDGIKLLGRVNRPSDRLLAGGCRRFSNIRDCDARFSISRDIINWQYTVVIALMRSEIVHSLIGSMAEMASTSDSEQKDALATTAEAVGESSEKGESNEKLSFTVVYCIGHIWCFLRK